MPDKDQPISAKDAKKKRLAEALRANLKRRKAQTRAQNKVDKN